jgi:hypothetical protein
LGALFLEEDFGVRGIVDSPHLNRFLRDTRIPLRGMVDWIVVLSFVDAKHDLSRSRAGLHCRRQLRPDVQFLKPLYVKVIDTGSRKMAVIGNGASQ